MYNTLNKDCKVVCLVRIAQWCPFHKRPRIWEYDNPAVLNVTPCVKQGSTYVDLRTREETEPSQDMEVWPVFTGTVFNYKDGESLLLSRMIADRKLVVLSLKKDEFKKNPLSMVERTVK